MSLLNRRTLLLGLLVGAAGIAILWAAGVEFPVAVPPGMVILLAGALMVALVNRTWGDALGGALGLFVLVGFVLSGINGDAEANGFDNLLGENGAAVAVGQLVQLVGVVLAAASSVLLVIRSSRHPGGAGDPARRDGGG